MVKYMVNKVLQFIQEKQMLLPEDRVIVGVSGGADSVCLLSILNRIKDIIPITIYVVHVEHGIRGHDSLEDAKFVEKLASDFHLEFRKFSYHVLEESKKTGLGTEEMARILRYQAFQTAQDEFQCNKIAIAHNKNDNAETLLFNLFRGSGLKGLSGIIPVRNNIIRPLLCLERNEIEEWLQEQEITYRTDQTNFEDEYTRNKIRLNVIPYVQEQINKQAISHVDAASKIIYEAWEYLEEETQKVYNQCVKSIDNESRIKISKLSNVSDILKKNIIRKCIGNNGNSLKDITNVHIDSVFGLLSQQSGRSVDLPNGIKAQRSYDEIVIGGIKTTSNQEKESVPIKIPGIYLYDGLEIEFSLENNQKNQIIPEKLYTKWLDYDKIGNDLRLRTRETGDYFVVNSCGGTKKLKTYFIDEKIERQKRDRMPLLCDEDHVIWIIGYRISEAYKVNKHTKRILKVQVNGGTDYV